MGTTGPYRSWALLLLLSLATTGLTIFGPSSPSAAAVAGALLVISGLKARIILADYLELRHSAFWMRGFTAFIGVFLIIAFILYALGSGRTE